MKRLVAPVLFCAILLGARPSYAQGGPETLEFSFSNPGARSIGLGGAFVALADDATAVYSNPAGLVQLARPEISIDGRFWSYSTPFTEGGRILGEPTGELLDSTRGLRTGVSREAISGISFLSFVYPKGDWSLAVYRHQLANFESSSETRGFFASLPGSDDLMRFDDIRRLTELDIVTYGFSGAYRVSENFSIGGAVVYSVGQISNTTEFYAQTEEALPEGPLGPNTFSPQALRAVATLITDDSDWGFNGGFLWNISNQWNLGGVFRQGSALELTFEERAGSANELGVPPETIVESGQEKLQLPDVFGLGVAYKSANGNLTTSFEWNFVQYSSFLRGISPENVTEGIEIDDANELHFGLEYVFLQTTPVIALRGGIWLDPDHKLRFVGDSIFTQAVFQPGVDEIHFSAGVGVAFRKFQIDFGVDLSDSVNTVSLSAIFSL